MSVTGQTKQKILQDEFVCVREKKREREGESSKWWQG